MRSLLKKYVPATVANWVRVHWPSFTFRKYSYSQCGEDLVINFVLELICGSRPKRYLDVGANHPFRLSNTALLYAAGGGRGSGRAGSKLCQALAQQATEGSRAAMWYPLFRRDSRRFLHYGPAHTKYLFATRSGTLRRHGASTKEHHTGRIEKHQRHPRDGRTDRLHECGH